MSGMKGPTRESSRIGTPYPAIEGLGLHVRVYRADPVLGMIRGYASVWVHAGPEWELCIGRICQRGGPFGEWSYQPRWQEEVWQGFLQSEYAAILALVRAYVTRKEAGLGAT